MDGDFQQLRPLLCAGTMELPLLCALLVFAGEWGRTQSWEGKAGCEQVLYLVPRLSLCSDPHAALAPQSSTLLPLQGASSSRWLPRVLASARELWAATPCSMPLVGLEDKQLERLRPWGWLSRCL